MTVQLEELLKAFELNNPYLKFYLNKNDECSLTAKCCKNIRHGAMEGTRTPGLLIRSQSLYPAELPTHEQVL